jgi:hypothetical protein
MGLDGADVTGLLGKLDLGFRAPLIIIGLVVRHVLSSGSLV